MDLSFSFKTVLIVILGLVAIFTLLVVILGWWFSAPGYSGTKTDNFNGKTFVNGEGYQEKGSRDFMKWMLNREPGEWTEKTESDIEYGKKPADRVTDSSQVITFINHSTFLIQTDGFNILTDPVYSKRVSPFSFAGPKRMRPPGIRFEDLPDIDFVLISHNHYDHLDIGTLKRVRETHDPLFITPLGIDLYLKENGISKTVSLNWWEAHKISTTFSISAVEAQHFSGRGIFDDDKTLWAGFVIESRNGNLYFAGDTGYNSFFKTIGEKYAPIKTAIIPIGAYIPRWFMNPVHVDPAQAVQAHHDLNAD